MFQSTGRRRMTVLESNPYRHRRVVFFLKALFSLVSLFSPLFPFFDPRAYMVTSELLAREGHESWRSGGGVG